MLSRFSPRLTFANAVSLLALFVALGGGALAASSFVGSDGQIHGCVGKRGQLTLLKPGKSCKKGAAITWNQQGTARAYAYVFATPPVGHPHFDLSRTSGFTAVKSGAHAGYYCLTPKRGISPGRYPAVGSIVQNTGFASSWEQLYVVGQGADTAAAGCKASQYAVVTLAGGSSPAPNQLLDFTLAIP